MSNAPPKTMDGRDFAWVERVDHQGIVTHGNLRLSLRFRDDPAIPFEHPVPILSAHHGSPSSSQESVSHAASAAASVASGQEGAVDSIVPGSVDVMLFNGDRLWVVPITLLGRGGQRAPTAPPFCYKLQKRHVAGGGLELAPSAERSRTDHATRNKAKQEWREFGKYACEAFTSFIEAEVDYSKNKNKKKLEAERLRSPGSTALAVSPTVAGVAEQVATLASLPEETKDAADGGQDEAAPSAAVAVAPPSSDQDGRGPVPPVLLPTHVLLPPALAEQDALPGRQQDVLTPPQRTHFVQARPTTPSATSQAEEGCMSRMTLHDSNYDAQSSVAGRTAPSSEGDASASQPRSHRRPTHRDRMRIRKEGLARDAARREAAAALELALAALEPTGSEEGGSSAASQAAEEAPPDVTAAQPAAQQQDAGTHHSSASSSASADSKKKDNKIAQVAGLLRQAVQRAFNPDRGGRGSQGGGSSRHSEGGAGPVDAHEQGLSPSGRMPGSGAWPRAGSSGGGGAGAPGPSMPRSPFDSYSRPYAAKPRGPGAPGVNSSARSVSSSVHSGSMGGWGHMPGGGPAGAGHRPTGSGYTPSYTSKRSGHEGSVAPMWAPDLQHQGHMQQGLMDGSVPMMHYGGGASAPTGYPHHTQAQHGYGGPMQAAPMQPQGMGYVPQGGVLVQSQGGYGGGPPGYMLQYGSTSPPTLPSMPAPVGQGTMMGMGMQQHSAPAHSNMTYLAVDNTTRQVHVLQGPGASGGVPPAPSMAPVPMGMALGGMGMPGAGGPMQTVQGMPMVQNTQAMQGRMMPQYQAMQQMGQQQPMYVHMMPSQ